ncbi:MAG TPA: NosD domain-containing protein [Stellaceae bacterium]|nr:NosD domain-containing protein [Stellaceae bacterium]
MTTFTVTNLNDSGAGSLRAAITAANADSGSPTVIDFAVNGTITLASALPALTHPVTIDATTAPTHTSGGPPVVGIDFAGNSGLVFDTGSDGSQLLGLSLTDAGGLGGNGVTLVAGSITLNNNYIGLDLSGQAAGNALDGVLVTQTSTNNQIGVNPTSSLGTTAAAGVVGNVISGNGGNGITLFGSSGNTIIVNRIGTDPTGLSAIANGRNGIDITGGSANNTIGGAAYIDATSGTANNPTGTEGGAVPTFVTPPLGNLISGNTQSGVLIDTGSENNTLSGNFIGTTADGSKPLGNGGDGVWINGADNNSLIGTSLLNPPGSPDPGSVNRTPFNYYNVVSGNGGNGLHVTDSDNVTVQANFFGVGANNASVVANQLNGILVDGSSQTTTVGGVIPLGNVSSGNGLNGIQVSGTASGFTSFNTFGGGLAFGPAAPNGNDGILITSDDSSGAGANVLQTNVFSGNTNNGIELAGNASGVQIDPNIVGLVTAGNAPLPNGGDGLLITGNANNNVIGGNVPSIIPNQAFSGNKGYGIAIVGQAHDNQITPFNMVGTGVSGLGPPVNPALPNGAGGILIGGSTYNNTIGGDASPNASGNTENVIAGNTGDAITVLAGTGDNPLLNNKIGVDQLGVPLPNGGAIVRSIGTGTFAGLASVAGQVSGLPSGQQQLALATEDGSGVTQTTIPGAQMGGEWTAVGMADFNSDGNADALWTNGTGGQAAIWELSNAQLVGFGIPSGQMGAEWQVGATGDFNGDGNADILWHAESGTDAGQVAIWSMDGTNLSGFSISSGQIGVEWNPVATGDFYGTGSSGVLWESNTGVVQDWSLNGPDLVTLNDNVGQIGAEWRVAGVGHFNGIGSGSTDNDIVWVDKNNDVQIWQMTNGVIGQIVTPVGNMGPTWSLEGVGDYTASGNSELLWVNANGQSVVWQLNGATVTPLAATPGTQHVASGQTVTAPTITNGTLQLDPGAIVQGPITFAAGATGTLYDADQGTDTVVGFNEGSGQLKFVGQNPTSEASVIASSQVVGGNTVLTFPDHTSVVLAGVTHVDTGIFS